MSRLGHASLKSIKLLFSHVKAIPKLQFESCQLRKHHRTSFPSWVVNHCSFPFEIVHTDIWGPTRVKVMCNFSYFIIFIDDYSRMT